MKFFLNLSALILFTSILTGQSTDSDKEFNEIVNTLNLYFEGTKNGEPEKLKEAFHPDFNLYTIGSNNELVIRSGEKYIANTEQGVTSNRIARIISIDYEKNSAIAKSEIKVPGWRTFIDYFLLLKIEGKWKIIHKSYSWREIEKTN